MMISKEDMARAYVEQVKSNIEQAKAQVAALEQHLKECEKATADLPEDAN